MHVHNVKVAAVIVTYNNATALKPLLDSLYSQSLPLNEIIVVDNASIDETGDLIKKNFPHLTYIRLNENTGSAGGFYEGIGAGIKSNDLIWTVDDDLVLYHDTLLRLLEGLEEVDKLGKVAAVRSVCTPCPGKNFKAMDGFAWRGTLIKTSAIKATGLPLKEYFLYGEDVEYSQRLLKAGYKLFFICNSLMKFSRENQTFYRICGKRISFYSNAPRLYYGFRNEVNVCVRYKLITRFLRHIAYAVGVVLCLLKGRESERTIKIKAILEGIFDGLVSKLGKNYNYLP